MLLDGLFRSHKDASAARLRVELSKEFAQGKVTVTYSGPQLSVDDLRTLQAVLALAAASRELVKSGKSSVSDPLQVEGSYRRLAQVAGYRAAGSGLVTARLEASIGRLGQGFLTILPSLATRQVDTPLVMNAAPERGPAARRQGFRLQLHPHLAQATRAGARGTHYLHLNMDEVRQLRSEAARLIHHRLCHMNLGEKLEHGLDTLVSYLGGLDAMTGSRHQWRHGAARVQGAIQELERLGWSFSDKGMSQRGHQKYLIHRPK